MKISEVTPDFVLDFIRVENDVQSAAEINMMMQAAGSYISSYTGIPQSGKDSLDNYEDLTIAFLVICQSLYDNRSFTVDGKEVN